jgi:hypothetical protein
VTYPVPERLAPIRREIHLSQGVATMLAIIAAICFILAFFNVTLGAHSLIALGLFFLALHFVVPVTVPGRRL